MHYIWIIFMVAAIIFFIYALLEYKKKIIPYLLVGGFLLIFDFFVETIGGFFDLWVTYESFICWVCSYRSNDYGGFWWSCMGGSTP
jgi:hypothetical protein